jgi:hypothetical protein
MTGGRPHGSDPRGLDPGDVNLDLDVDLDADLRALAAGVEFPPTPDLVPRVRGELAEPARRQAWWPFATGRATRRSLVLAIVALLAAAGIVAAGIFGIGPLRIVRVETLPSLPPAATPNPTAWLGSNLGLGRETTIDDAVGQVEFKVFRPTAAELATPDAVYFGKALAGGQVSLVYGPGASRPSPTESGVSVLITEFQGTLQERLADKIVGPGTTVDVITVNGGLGFWIEGRPHEIVYRDPSGQFVLDSFRLVRNSLAWDQDGTIIRIEGSLSRTDALAIAATMAPIVH